MPMILVVLLMGWFAGALVNYLADVLPEKRRLAPAACEACGKEQPAWKLYIWPRRCEFCGKGRPWRNWLVLAAATGATLWIWLSPPATLGFLASYILLIYLGLVAVIDLEHRLILHPVSLAGAILCAILGSYLHGFASTLLGGIAGFTGMLLLYFLGFVFSRFMGRMRGVHLEEEALGFGDVLLAGVLGLILGWPGITLGLFLAIVSGGLFSLVYLAGMALTRRYRAFTAIPYGPFLIAGAAALLFFRDYFLAYLGR